MYGTKVNRILKYIFILLIMHTVILVTPVFQKTSICSQTESIAAESIGKPSQENKTIIYLFWGEGCHSCEEIKPFLEEMKVKYPGLEVKDYEIFNSKENKELLLKMLDEHNSRFSGVPVTFIGDKKFQGFRETVKEELEGAINICMAEGCIDPVSKIVFESSDEPKTSEPVEDENKEEKIKDDEPRNTTQRNNAGSESVLEAQPGIDSKEQSSKSGIDINQKSGDNKQKSQDDSTLFEIPILGRMDAAKLSIPLVTVLLAGVDSFNPCAFFVLFSLLGLLVHARSRRKMLLIGSIFVFFSGFIYFMFMAAWLNLFLVLGHIKTITLIAGIVSVLIAVINIKDFFFFKKGISLTIPDHAKPKLFDRMRKLIKSTSLPTIVLGTIILAVVANSYELLCTAGFPMVFTRALTLNNLPSFTYYMYLALYNFIYIIPLAVIVLVFTITLGKRNISEWQGRVLKFVSGAMMMGLGLILIVDPSILNNLIISFGIFFSTIASSLVISFLMKNKLTKTRD